MKKHVLIVGTGLGGLATGLRLIANGYQVTFVEKCAQPGGRLNQLQRDGFTFDLGPSFFSMPYEFEALIQECGLEMPFEFVELDPLYAVRFRGHEQVFYLYKDIDKMAAQFEGIETNFKEKFIRYLKKCKALFNDTIDLVIKKNYNGLIDYALTLNQVNKAHLPVLLRSFWGQVNLYFESDEARQIITLISFFLGSTPFATNGIYTLLSYIEFQHTGYYNVKGGMYTVVNRLVEALEQRGARFHYNTEIVNFEADGNKLQQLRDKNGNCWKADAFVINGDAAYFRGTIFQRKKYSESRLKKMEWTMGYLTFYIGVNKKLPQIEHHNYFLGNDYNHYARAIVKGLTAHEKPYYYVNVMSKHNLECAPEGCEALLFVCPVPNLMHKPHWNDKEEIIEGILEDFSQRIGYDIKPDIIFKTSYTPEDWRDQFHLFQGAGLGLSHAMMQIGGLRPANQDELFGNVCYVGASTVPGAGLPMAVISAKLAFERVEGME